MKNIISLSEHELDSAVQSWQFLQGARLQGAQNTSLGIELEFYGGHKELYFVYLDMKKSHPFIWIFTKKMAAKQKPLPLVLFLQAHFKNQHLNSIVRLEKWGRVVSWEFSDHRCIEIHLIPHAANIKAVSGNKEIYFRKPQPLKEHNASPEILGTPRDLGVLQEEWLQQKQKLPKKKSDSLQEQKTKWLKIIENIERQESQVGYWQDVLRQSQQDGFEPTEQIKQAFKNPWSLPQFTSWVHQKIKQEKKKDVLREERIRELREQIAKQPEANKGSRPLREPLKLKSAPFKAHKLEIEPDLIFFVGTSAKENLKLLRASKPWYIWLHLRDQPGAFGVLFRTKKHKLTDKHLREMAAFYVKSVWRGRKLSQAKQPKGKFSFIYTECRFVKPIKGDKLGRVNYKNDSNFVFSL